MFELFLDSAYRITESIRYHDVVQVNDKTGYLYALIYDNHSLYTRLMSDMRKVDLHKEMILFINQRMSFLLKSICDKLCVQFNIKIDDILNGHCLFINDTKYDHLNTPNRMELEKLEYDIDQMIKIAEVSNDPKYFNSEQYDFTSEHLSNRFEVLKYLLRLFYSMLDMSQTQTMKRSSTFIINNINDSCSLPCLSILSYLIMKVAISLYKTKGSFDPVSIKESKHRMIGDDFSHFENVGSMSLTNVLCCFKNVEYLNMIIDNPNGSSSQEVRTVLYDMLLLNKVI